MSRQWCERSTERCHRSGVLHSGNTRSGSRNRHRNWRLPYTDSTEPVTDRRKRCQRDSPVPQQFHIRP